MRLDELALALTDDMGRGIEALMSELAEERPIGTVEQEPEDQLAELRLAAQVVPLERWTDVAMLEDLLRLTKRVEKRDDPLVRVYLDRARRMASPPPTLVRGGMG